MPRTRSLGFSELKLGIVGVIALFLTTILVFAVGGQGGFFWQRYPLRTVFDNVAGLKTGAVVRLNGMEVGKVTVIEFSGAEVEVEMELSRSIRHLVTSDSEASMGTLSMLGEPIVEVRAASTGTPLADGAYLPSTQAGGIAELANTAAQGIRQVDHLIADLRAGQGTLGKLITDDTLYVELNAALENVQSITAEVKRGDGTLSRLLNDPALGSSLTEASANLDQITDRLARGEGTAGKLLTDQEMYDRLNNLMLRVDRLVGELESGGGTAGQLLHDPLLYQNTSQAVAELRDLIADVRRDPKRYLGVTLRVF